MGCPVELLAHNEDDPDGSPLQLDAEHVESNRGRLIVAVGGSTLPAGAATSANQTTQITAEQAILGALNRVLTHVNIDFSSGSAQTIVAAPAAGYRIRVVSIEISALVNVEIAVKSGATTIRTFQGAAVVWAPPTPANLGEAEALVLDAVTADRITGGVSYYVEAI
jgi:hypothetical protein